MSTTTTHQLQLLNLTELIGKRIKAVTDTDSRVVLLFDDDTFAVIEGDDDDGYRWAAIVDHPTPLDLLEQDDLDLITMEQRLAKEQASRDEQARLEKEERRKRYEAMRLEFEGGAK